MVYPQISEYINSILCAEDNFATLTNLRPVLNQDGNPIMNSGNFAVVFKMYDIHSKEEYAIKCFIKDEDGRDESYKLISKELKYIESQYILHVEYIHDELFVDSKTTDATEFPIVKMNWINGVTLDLYIKKIYKDPEALEILSYKFSLFAKWLVSQPYAHGDLKPENILVRNDGCLVLVDYDGMYTPDMANMKARELGSPRYRHPLLTENDFDKHIDDFALASINLSLVSIATDPNLCYDFPSEDFLLFGELDYKDITSSKVFNRVLSLLKNNNVAKSISWLLLVLVDKKLCFSNDLFCISKPKVWDSDYYYYEAPFLYKMARLMVSAFYLEPTWVWCSFDEKWEDNLDVIYSKDGKILKRFYLNEGVRTYYVNEGTKHIKPEAFGWFFSYETGDFYNDLESLYLPESIEELDFKIFDNTNIKYIFVPKGSVFSLLAEETIKIVELPENFDLQKHYNLSINVYEDDIARGIVDEFGVIYSEDNIRLLKCTKPLKKYKIKDGTLIICDNAFCYGVEKVEIPNSVILMSEYAFFNNIPNSITNHAGRKIEKLIKVMFATNYKNKAAEGDIDGYFYSTDGRSFVNYGDHYYQNEYIIKDGTINICDESFNDLYDEFDSFYLRKLTIPSSVKYIGKNVFNLGIEEIVCNSKYFKVKNYALLSSDEKQLIRYFGKEEKYYVDPNVETIVGGAFSGYLNLKEIHFDRNIKYIGDNPFVGLMSSCKNFQISCFSSHFKYINNALYDNENRILIAYCGKEKHFEIEDGTKYIGANAFGFSEIESITVPETLVGINKSAFFDCFKLKSIVPRTTTKESIEHLTTIFKDMSTWTYNFDDKRDEHDYNRIT